MVAVLAPVRSHEKPQDSSNPAALSVIFQDGASIDYDAINDA
jgi:phage baseplate assembly protein gpV